MKDSGISPEIGHGATERIGSGAAPGGQADRTHRIVPFVPPLLLDRYARDPRAVDEPFEELLSAAVLSVDVAGFTRLTEQLDSEGLAGVERLSGLLNGYFVRLIGILESHGGRVMNFTGDGLAALWPTRDGDVTEATLRAAAGGLAVQEQLHDFSPTEDIRLSIRLGLAAGAVRHMVVGGGEGQWLSMLAGDCVQRSLRAAEAATPGQVVVSPQSWPSLWGRARGTEDAHGFVVLRGVEEPLDPIPYEVPALADEAEEALSRHVPAPIRGRLSARESGWVAEHRPVTLLFIGVPEVAVHEAGALARAQMVTSTLQKAVQRFEGTVDTLPVEFGGIAMLAAFGLPPLAHEDDAARAVRAALAIRGALRDMGYTAGIGVTTGALFCRLVGGATRRTYTMIGDAANRSARLMRLAEDDVLCDGGTRDAAYRHLRFSFLGNAAVRGKEATVPIYRPIGEERRLAPEAGDFVGRRSERHLLESALDDLVSRRRGGTFAIEGDAGIGKSALVAAMIGKARELNVRVLFGGGDSIDRSSSYRAWTTVFARLLDLPADADRDEREERAFVGLGRFPAALRIAPVLNPALSTYLPENEVTAHMNPQSRAEAANGALVDLLREASDAAPTLVVLDDCHWLDSASFALAEEVRKRLPALLLVLVARRSEGLRSAEWTSLGQRDGVRQLPLSALPREDAEELVRRRLGVRKLPEAVSALVRQRAEGHPLFCEQLAYTLRDKGYVAIEDSECRISPEAGDLRTIKFPENVHGAVRERVDRLSEDERVALKAASVVGRHFTLEALEAILPSKRSGLDVGEVLERLAKDGFLSRGPADGDFLFKHAIIQEVSYELLTLSQRRRLHECVASWIEETARENPEPFYPILSFHWKTAGATEKAVRFLGLAGNQALGRFANREAVAFLQEALSGSAGMDVPAVQRGIWHRQIGEAYFRMGRMDQGKEHLQKAVAIFGYPVPSPLLLKTAMLPAALCRQVANRVLGVAPTRGNRSSEARLEAIKAYGFLGEIAFFTNDMPGTIFSCVHALNLAESSESSAALAPAYGTMMIACASVPPVGIGRHYLKLTKEAMDWLNTPNDEAYVLALMSMYHGGVGSWREGGECLTRAEAIFGRFGNSRRLEDSLTIRIYNSLNQGHFAQALEAVKAILRSARDRGDPQTMGWARLLHAQSLLPTRGGEEALKALGTDLSTATDALTRAANHAIEAEALLRAGEAGRARRSADTALGLLRNGPPVAFSLSLSVSYLAGVYLTLLEDAKRRGVAPESSLELAVRRAMGVLGGFARVFPIGRPRAYLWQAVHATLSGRGHKARRLWERALTAAERMGMRHDAGVVLYHRGRLSSGDEARRLLGEAARIFDETGAEYDRQRAEEVLERDFQGE